MGMYADFCRINNEKLNEFLKKPKESYRFFRAIDFEYKKYEEKGLYVEIGKTWDIIHYLLTGSTTGKGEPPTNWVIYGDKTIGDYYESYGYGPPGYLLPKQVKEVAEFLSSITQEKLFERYYQKPENRRELVRRKKIYAYPCDDLDEYDIEDISESFLKLVDFYKNAAMANDCVICLIS